MQRIFSRYWERGSFVFCFIFNFFKNLFCKNIFWKEILQKIFFTSSLHWVYKIGALKCFRRIFGKHKRQSYKKFQYWEKRNLPQVFPKEYCWNFLGSYFMNMRQNFAFTKEKSTNEQLLHNFSLLYFKK